MKDKFYPFTTEELRTELKRRDEAAERAKYPNLKRLNITEETMNEKALMVIQDGNLLIQYPDGHNEYWNSLREEWRTGGFTGHKWIIQSIKAGESQAIGWL